VVLPLEGIRILDTTRILPGPFCTMWLADMGADVIKIEETRGRYSDIIGVDPALPQLTEEQRDDLLTACRLADRNKRSVTLNLKSEEGRGVFHRLAKQADVVVVEARPGVSKRLGIDYETLKEVNPAIIQCEITAYGQTGPYRGLPAHDPNCIGVAGVLGITGTADGCHILPGVPLADLGGGGMQGVIGILCALFAREKTGRGQSVDISMTDGVLFWLATRHGGRYFATGKQPRLGERPALVYETKDSKYIVVAPLEPWLWERFCRTLGLEEYIPYRDYVMEFCPDDRGKREEILLRIAEVFRTRTRDEWFRLLAWEADTCASPVYETFEEVFSDPQVLHRQMIVEMDHPTLGKVKQVGIPIKLSDTPGKIRTLPPRHGQHTDEVLRETGYTLEEIGALRKTGVIS